MRPGTWLLVVAVVAMWGMKRHYSEAGADDLRWILGPTAHLAGAATGAAFVPAPGEGYLSHERLFLIEKACAGINFMIAAFGMLTFVLRRHARSWSSAAGVFGVALLASYSSAVVVNAVRITIAMWLAARPRPPSLFTWSEIHRLEGIAVYFGGLVLLHQAALRTDGRRRARRMLPGAAGPLVWYYVITLAVPIANGATFDEAFSHHAAIVVVFPLVLIGAWASVRKVKQLAT
jgi:exosortase K